MFFSLTSDGFKKPACVLGGLTRPVSGAAASCDNAEDIKVDKRTDLLRLQLSEAFHSSFLVNHSSVPVEVH